MSPAAPILITVALVIPPLFLAMYFHRYIHLARRPDVARLKVLRWVFAALVVLILACAAFQTVCFLHRWQLHLAAASVFVWPGLAALFIAVWLQIRRLQKRINKAVKLTIPDAGRPAPRRTA